MRIRVLVGIILVIALLAGTSCFGGTSQASSFSGQFTAKVQPYSFNLGAWEFSTFLSSLKTQTLDPGPQSALTAQNVLSYFSTMSQEDALRSQMQQASTKNPEPDMSDMSASQSRMNALEDRQAALAPIVEQTLADQISHIQRKEIAGVEKAVHRLEVDVIGVEEVGLRPSQFLHGCVRRCARLHRLGSDDRVLSVGFIPHRHNFNTGIGSQYTCGKLGLRLVSETIANANRKLRKCQFLNH